jgi:hypothetical protein
MYEKEEEGKKREIVKENRRWSKETGKMGKYMANKYPKGGTKNWMYEEKFSIDQDGMGGGG